MLIMRLTGTQFDLMEKKWNPWEFNFFLRILLIDEYKHKEAS